MAKLSLKTQNIAPLGTLTLFILSVAFLISNGGIDRLQLPSLVPAAGTLAVVGVVATWLSYLIPAGIKHILIFLRFRNVLPGHRFLNLSAADPRIDSEVLKTGVEGYEALVSDGAAQNRYWYNKIYRPLVDQVEVASAHKSFLLYRDCATVSLICLLVIAIGQRFSPNLVPFINHSGLAAIAVFTMLLLLASNTAGNRFVTTTVAVYLARKDADV